ncbi:mechanosensitive ion channel family protein [[Eubacterium] cellulosolvens]
MNFKRKLIYFFILLFSTILIWLINFEHPNNYLLKGFYTLLSLTIIYCIFKLIFEEIIVKRIKESKTRYSLNKAISILEIIIFLIVILTIWVQRIEALFVTFGLFAAGLAIALQDLFKNFVGGIMIFITGIYRVGDRIEIESKYGDVMDIGIFYTTLMEINEWVGGEQATGRLKTIPNGQILTNAVNNYTKDHKFIWDELTLPITYDSDWNVAIIKIMDILKKETEQITKIAENEIAKIGEKYYLPQRIVEPSIYLSLTDNWINFGIRYVTEVRERRFTRNKISQLILKEIDQSPKIKIASETIDIVGFPDKTN